MDIKKAKQAAAVAWLVLGALAMVGGATVTQLLPVAGFLVLAYLDLYKGKNVGIIITVIAALMILVNLSIGSVIDIAMWALVAGAFYPRKALVAAKMPVKAKTVRKAKKA